MTTSPVTAWSSWGFSTVSLIAEARQKLPRRRVDEVALLGGLTKKEMALVLGVTERNLYNQHQGDLSVPMSERLLILEKLFQHGLAVFDANRPVLDAWLRTPLAELATPESGFAAPLTDYVSRPVAEMGSTDMPADLLSAATARRNKLVSNVPADSVIAYPTPLSLLDTITGCKLVDNVFTRIEAGVFS